MYSLYTYDRLDLCDQVLYSTKMVSVICMVYIQYHIDDLYSLYTYDRLDLWDQGLYTRDTHDLYDLYDLYNVHYDQYDLLSMI